MNRSAWLYWGIITLGLLAYLGMQLFGEDKRVFLPGATTHGHHQIEMACAACHSEPLGGGTVLQDACMNCHAQELKLANDSHPRSKFTDPRNAARVAKLDARECITCHTEHRPEITRAMGVTVPDDVCFVCHADIAEDRPSHKGMSFVSCATGGCHNFHDNRALYEDFLVKHLADADNLDAPHLMQKSDKEVFMTLANYPIERYPLKALQQDERDMPLSVRDDARITSDWLETSHSQAGVNCSACHNVTAADGVRAWVDKPTHESCMSCHTQQVDGFLSGKHGMRLAQGLTPMTPALARIPMHDEAASKQLSCTSCHSAHRFDTRHAAVESCLGCHVDEHSLQYKKSAHFGLWHNELTGRGAKETGVSCASCHMPRTESKTPDGVYVHAQHNQNDNLRPNEKMLRSVCMNCHGLGFSLDALADQALVQRNFIGKPAKHIESIDMAGRRHEEAPQRKTENR